MNPEITAKEWICRKDDPPGFQVKEFQSKGRGVVTTTSRGKGEFLLVYKGELISEEEGERRETEDGGSGYRFFFNCKGKKHCIDATEESEYPMGRLVNHGRRTERNAMVKETEGTLCLFSTCNINVGDEILYDYGLTILPWEVKTRKRTVHKRKGQLWGTVYVVKRGIECDSYPMCSPLLLFGSASSCDIIVHTAIPQEVIIEVNKFGEVFMVDACTRNVKRLEHNDVFEVGGRLFKWKYPHQNESIYYMMDLVEVMGKQNKKVPVLLTPRTKTGIDLLIHTRDKCDIDVNNQYVFAKGSNTFIEGCEALSSTLQSIPNLKRPEALKFPALRKYFATVVQVFGMDETDLQEVARHMGHELTVHRKFYRLQDDIIELAKIAKLLLAVESGKASEFKGMSLDDLDVNDFHFDGYDVGQDIPPEDCQQDSAQVEAFPDETIPGESVVVDVPTSVQQSTAVAQPLQLCSGSSEIVDMDSQITHAGSKGKWKRVFQCTDGDSDSDSVVDKYSGDTETGSSEDEMLCSRGKRRKTQKGQKKIWTPSEKRILEPLDTVSLKTRKPPVKEEVTKIQLKCESLRQLPWIKIKHQVWAMSQAKRKKMKN